MNPRVCILRGEMFFSEDDATQINKTQEIECITHIYVSSRHNTCAPIQKKTTTRGRKLGQAKNVTSAPHKEEVELAVNKEKDCIK